MATNTLILGKPQVANGLQTMTYTVPSTEQSRTYNVQVQLTEVPPTGLSVVVNKNGSPIFTAPAITPTQIAQQFRFSFIAAASDVITVVLASSAAIDAGLNNVKSTITLSTGM